MRQNKRHLTEEKGKVVFSPQPQPITDQFCRRAKLEQVLTDAEVKRIVGENYSLDDLFDWWSDTTRAVSGNGDLVLKDNHPDTIRLLTSLLDEAVMIRWAVAVLFFKVTGRHFEDDEDAYLFVEKLAQVLRENQKK